MWWVYAVVTQDRLTKATYSGDSRVANNGTSTYSYDKNGNRITESFTTEADLKTKDITYSYDANDQLTNISDTAESSSTTISYDQLGNLTQKAKTQGATTDTTDYVYDVRNQLKQVQIGGSTVGQFLYDANGLRTHKTETLNSITSQKRYHYQNLNVIGESDEDGNALFNYYHDGQTIIGREDAQADSNDLDKLQSYHHDSLGSIALISKTDGSLNARYQYDAFGNVQNESGNSENNDYTYTGHERDQATGLVYAKARYYDPQLGLFLSRDPFEGYDNTPMSLHRYLYAYQNPNKYVDPDGREPITLTAIAIYAGWSGLNAGINTGIDYGFHKIFGDEGDEFNLGENYATNFAISAATGGVGAYAKHAPKVKKVGEAAVEFSGEVYKEYTANKEDGASFWQAAGDTAISMTIGKAAADTIGKKAGELYDGATGVVGELKGKLGIGVSIKEPLPYDITNWKEYGLPSNGVFSRSLRPSEAQDFIEGKPFVFGGRPIEAYKTKDDFIDPGYPAGQGFIGKAEDTSKISTKKAYQELYKLEKNQVPEFVLDFQLKDPGQLQNVLYAPYELFERGGKTGGGLSEYNYPGISSDDLLNPVLRSLE